MLPVRVEMERRHQVVRIASGGDHLALLTWAGELLTMGNSEQVLCRPLDCSTDRGAGPAGPGAGDVRPPGRPAGRVAPPHPGHRPQPQQDALHTGPAPGCQCGGPNSGYRFSIAQHVIKASRKFMFSSIFFPNLK